jgi:hypothetical protein
LAVRALLLAEPFTYHQGTSFLPKLVKNGGHDEEENFIYRLYMPAADQLQCSKHTSPYRYPLTAYGHA